MPVRTHSSPAHGGTPAVEVRNPAGRVSVTAVEDAVDIEVVVEPLNQAAEALLDEVTIEFLRSGPGDVAPRWTSLLVAVPTRRLLANPRFTITVTVPAGGPVTTVVASAETVLRGRLGDVQVTGASGDLVVESCTRLRVKTASGVIRAALVRGDLSVGSASGDLHVEEVTGSATVKAASGQVRLGTLLGDVDIATASADVTVGRASCGEVRLRTVSGDATVTVAPDLRLWLDLQSVSGRLDSRLDHSSDDAGTDPATLRVTMRSVSGDLRLRRAG